LPLEDGSPGEIAMHQQNESGSAIATLDTPGAPDVGRRNLLKMTGVGITSLSVGTVSAAQAVAQPQTTPLSFMTMPILRYIAEISPRPVLFVHAEKAHSRYFSETAYAAAAPPKELMIVPRAGHADLYDRVDVIPFDKLTAFFRAHLA
jgi:fermentation-respiration switch protein FrsA (DUF1100 family)